MADKNNNSNNALTPKTLTKEKKETHPKLADILEDLCSRFIVNCPREECSNFERIGFQLEQAHWFYLDFYREMDPTLPFYDTAEFFAALFNQCPLLRPYQTKVNDCISQWFEYKFRVPTCGAIILNSTLDKCLLVRGYNSRSWGFPKGKINKDESAAECAAREVYEEIGFDLTDYIKEKDCLELCGNERVTKLFIVGFVSESVKFETFTRKEISQIEWHTIADLPKTWVEAKERSKADANFDGERFYLVIPFVRRIISWIKKKVKELKQEQQNPKNLIIKGSTTSPLHYTHEHDKDPMLKNFAPINYELSQRVTKPKTNGSNSTTPRKGANGTRGGQSSQYRVKPDPRTKIASEAPEAGVQPQQLKSRVDGTTSPKVEHPAPGVQPKVEQSSQPALPQTILQSNTQEPLQREDVQQTLQQINTQQTLQQSKTQSLPMILQQLQQPSQLPQLLAQSQYPLQAQLPFPSHPQLPPFLPQNGNSMYWSVASHPSTALLPALQSALQPYGPNLSQRFFYPPHQPTHSQLSAFQGRPQQESEPPLQNSMYIQQQSAKVQTPESLKQPKELPRILQGLFVTSESQSPKPFQFVPFSMNEAGITH